jgi:hypothetical protein
MRWFHDKEISKFIGDRLDLLAGRHSMRFYVQASEWKRAKLDWRDLLLRSWELDPKVARIVQLLSDPSLTQAQRAAIFISEGHGSRRNFFYLCAKLRKAGAVAACTSAPTPSAKVQGKPSRARAVRQTAPSKKVHTHGMVKRVRPDGKISIPAP